MVFASVQLRIFRYASRSYRSPSIVTAAACESRQLTLEPFFYVASKTCIFPGVRSDTSHLFSNEARWVLSHGASSGRFLREIGGAADDVMPA